MFCGTPGLLIKSFCQLQSISGNLFQMPWNLSGNTFYFANDFCQLLVDCVAEGIRGATE
jgi:hypothetical protein